MKFKIGSELLLLFFLTFHCIASSNLALEQQAAAGNRSTDAFDQQVEHLELRDESIFTAISKLSQSVDVAFSIEGILLPKQEIQPPPDPKFSATIQGKTLKEVLDWLCAMDPRYTWRRDGNTTNFFPSAKLDDKLYFLNRKIPLIMLHEAKDAGDAVFAALQQLPEPKAHLIFLQAGGSLRFAKLWTETMSDLTVRQAFNRIAQELGPTFGWQIGGTQSSPIIMFHYRLGSPSSRE